EHDTDAMTVGDVKKSVHTLKQSVCVVFPKEIVQEHSYRVEAEPFRPSKLAVDGSGIKGFGFPHVKLIDSRGWRIVATKYSTAVAIPAVDSLLAPAQVRRSTSHFLFHVVKLLPPAESD